MPASIGARQTISQAALPIESSAQVFSRDETPDSQRRSPHESEHQPGVRLVSDQSHAVLSVVLNDLVFGLVHRLKQLVQRGYVVRSFYRLRRPPSICAQRSLVVRGAVYCRQAPQPSAWDSRALPR